MSTQFELVIEGSGVVPHAVTVGKRPFSVGRGAENDLVVPDGMVSWEHMRVWADHGQVWLSDAGSTNGTFVNGSRIKGTVQLSSGDKISIGDAVQLTVTGQISLNLPPLSKAIALEDVQSGLKHPFRLDRFTVGSAPGSDLRVPGTTEEVEVHFALRGEEYWLLKDNDDVPLELGEVVEVAGMQLRLVEVGTTRMPTINPMPNPYPYRLHATLDGPTGPVATLENMDTDVSCRVEAETRAILLYLLGKQIDQDRRQGVTGDELGWCPDDDVIVGVWGRSGLADGANRLKVLVHRLRAEIKKVGFDPWFIERRRRFIRARVAECQID